MLLYALLMFAFAALFLGVGIAIRRGNTKLIHDYHQTKVREDRRLEYARDFSRGILMISAALFLSGVLALFGKEGPMVTAALLLLFAGIIAAVVILVRVQKKYNGGLF